MSEIDCRKCFYCNGSECTCYHTDNPNVAVKKCANDSFRNYLTKNDMVVKVNDFVASGTERLLAKIAKLESERKWIPVSEQLPFTGTTTLATVRHRRWISDMGTEDEVDHLERIEVCSVYYDGEYYVKLDDTEYGNLVYIPGKVQEEDIEYPIEEVLAWMPLPDAYEEE